MEMGPGQASPSWNPPRLQPQPPQNPQPDPTERGPGFFPANESLVPRLACKYSVRYGQHGVPLPGRNRHDQIRLVTATELCVIITSGNPQIKSDSSACLLRTQTAQSRLATACKRDMSGPWLPYRWDLRVLDVESRRHRIALHPRAPFPNAGTFI